MCGLVGATAQKDVTPFLIEGLKRLEYRGYDSAGLSILDGKGALKLRRCVGKVDNLEAHLNGDDWSSRLGIGHTRWATHGIPDERNAHPHLSGNQIAVVHNGIIENHLAIREFLQEYGYGFGSDTDTEAIAHLIHYHYQFSGNLMAAVKQTVLKLKGAFAIAAIARTEPGTLILARQDSPLVIGVGEEQQFAASDVAALLPVTRHVIHLENGDIAELTCTNVNIHDRDGGVAIRALKQVKDFNGSIGRGTYPHFMLKEIFEQPKVVGETLRGHLAGDHLFEDSLGLAAAGLLERIRAVHMVACGTSHHAAEVGRYWIESMANLPCSVDLASEFRYRTPHVPADCLMIGLSQSGETADTLGAMRYATDVGYLATLAVCNVPESSLVRESDLSLLTRAGPEVGVASTKAFTTQLISMLVITLLLARRNGMDHATERSILEQLSHLDEHINTVLKLSPIIRNVAAKLVDYDHALFLGRGPMYPIAKEGALKLKEISYIHAEGYAAGELKHGPLALVDEEMPVIALAPNNGWIHKLKSNLQEVRSRGGELFVFTDTNADVRNEVGLTVITLPVVDDLSAPIVYSVAMQLLAYHAAVIRGTDVDRPRNLAKSVTVE
jgi:glutamine---fructose-6-phosphate transaminase (isomerizing)